MRQTTRDRLTTLRAEGKLPEFSQELDNWIGAYQDQSKLRFMSQSEIAEKLGVKRAALNSWLQGRNLPDEEHCRTIAEFFHVPLDLVLQLADHPNFVGLIKRVEAQGKDWSDRLFILEALETTQRQKWKQSRSPWKERAELELMKQWLAKDVHDAALSVATLVYFWGKDTRREMPLAQRKPAVELAV